MVEMQIHYVGELRCEASHTPSGVSLVTDAPVDNHGKGESFSPTDLVATALGACMLTIMGIVAQRDELALEGTKVTVRKHMNTEGVRRIGKLEVEISLPLAEDHPARAKIERAALTCPVHGSLHPDIEIPIVWNWQG